LVADSKEFEKELCGICELNDVRVAFDCVAGEETGKLMKALGKEGVVINYGNLSGKEISGINNSDLTFRKKVLRGFMVHYWLNSLADSEK